eukprot:1151686-Pelagomonas_calceolata.AAC.10
MYPDRSQHVRAAVLRCPSCSRGGLEEKEEAHEPVDPSGSREERAGTSTPPTHRVTSTVSNTCVCLLTLLRSRTRSCRFMSLTDKSVLNDQPELFIRSVPRASPDWFRHPAYILDHGREPVQHAQLLHSRARRVMHSGVEKERTVLFHSIHAALQQDSVCHHAQLLQQ